MDLARQPSFRVRFAPLTREQQCVLADTAWTRGETLDVKGSYGLFRPVFGRSSGHFAKCREPPRAFSSGSETA